MAEGFKVLGQGTLAVTEATLYTVPFASGASSSSRRMTQAVISSIIVCCVSGTLPWYSIRVKKLGDVDSDEQIIFFEKSIDIKTTDILSLGIGLVAGDSIEASAKSATVIHMNIFGTEST
jgi:hypothetical protein